MSKVRSTGCNYFLRKLSDNWQDNQLNHYEEPAGSSLLLLPPICLSILRTSSSLKLHEGGREGGGANASASVQLSFGQHRLSTMMFIQTSGVPMEGSWTQHLPEQECCPSTGLPGSQIPLVPLTYPGCIQNLKSKRKKMEKDAKSLRL